MRNIFVFLYVVITLTMSVFAEAEFTKSVKRDPWPRRRLYILETNMERFETVKISRDRFGVYSEKLIWEDRKTYKIVFNSNATKFAAIFDEYGYKKLFYVEPGDQRLQEFSFAWGFSDSDPVISHDGRHIFFVSDRFGNKEIFHANFEQYKKQRKYYVDFVIDNLSDNHDLSVSADGRRLAYRSKKENGPSLIYVAELEFTETETNTIIRVTNEMMPSLIWEESSDPVLSGDGHFLAFSVEGSSSKQILVCDLTKKIKLMVTANGYPLSQVGMSYDGNKIVFVSIRKNPTRDVYMMDRRAQRLYNLTDDPKSHDYFPTISDDGMRIAYQANGKWDQKAIKVLDLKTKKIYWFWERKANLTRPRISGDGKTLVYLHNGVLHKIRLERIIEKVGGNPSPENSSEPATGSGQTAN